MSISAAWLLDHAALTWREIAYGIRLGFLSPLNIPRIAAAKMQASESSDTISMEMDLASCNPEQLRLYGNNAEPILLEKIAGLENGEPDQDVDSILARWKCLAVTYLVSCADEFSDLKRTFDDLVADLGYPEDMAGLVSYYIPPAAMIEVVRGVSVPRDLISRAWAYIRDCCRVAGSSRDDESAIR